MVVLVAVILLVLGLLRLEELHRLRRGDHLVDEIAEDAGRRRSRRLGLGIVGAVAQPDGHGVLRGHTAEPAVLLVVGGTGLAAGLLAVIGASRLAGAVVDDHFHAVEGRPGHFAREHPLARGVGVVHDDVAVLVLDGDDALRIVVDAAVGHRGIGVSHFERRDRTDAQGKARHRRQIGGDAHGVGHLDHLIDAHGEKQANKRRVRRHAESALDGARAVIGLIVVVDRLAALQINLVAGIDERFRVDALVDSRQKREQLERRSGLTARAALARGHVHLRALVIATAHQRVDVAVLGVHNGHGHLEGIAGLLFLFGRSLFGGGLGLDIQRRDHLQPALEQLGGGIGVLALGVGQLVAHVAREVGVGQNARHGGLGGVQLDGLGLHRVGLLRRDNPVGHHAVEHGVAALQAVVRIIDGVVVGGRLGNAHERGRLVQREVLRVLGEVALGGGLDTVGTGTVVDSVQVHEQDLVFGVLLFQLLGNVHLADLALEGDVAHLVGKNRVAHELLSDGGSALQLAAHEVVHERAGHTEVVDAGVGVEALVLGGNGALQHVLADLVESHRVAILQLELGEQRRAVRCVNHGWLRRVVSVGVLVVGQILQPGVAQRHHAEHARRDKGDEHAQHRQNDDLLILYFRALTALHCARTHELTSISYRSGHFTNELWRVHKMEPPPGNAQRTAQQSVPRT